MADQKSPVGEKPGNTGAESGGGTSSNLGGMDSGQIQESAFHVFKTAARQSAEDVKNIMGEHMKGAEAGGPDDLHLQDSMAEDSLADVNLQEFDQHQPQVLQEMSNVAEKISDADGSIITGKLGGAGQHKAGVEGRQLTSVAFESANRKNTQLYNLRVNLAKAIGDMRMGVVGNMDGGSSKKKPGLGILTALLFLIIAALVAVRFLVPGMMPPDSTVPNAGPPAVNVPDPDVTEQPVAYPPNPCAPAFDSPTGPEAIPLSGPLDVQWPRVVGAASYELQVIPPEGEGNPWLVKTDGTSKKIYMENFPAAGQHKFVLSALSRDGMPLCSIEMVFDKPAFGDEAGQARDSEAAAGECNTLGPCVP